MLISRLDLESLRACYPELYETVEDSMVRKVLITSELFKPKLESILLRRFGVEAPWDKDG